jgi:hypothetical protein
MTRACDPIPDIVQERAVELIAKGYSVKMAEALAENGYDAASAFHLTSWEALDLWLQWEGIIGFTSSILHQIRAIENLKGPLT